jgi:YbbR domain-containing protein
MPGELSADWMWNVWKTSWQLSSVQTNPGRKIFSSGIFLTFFLIRTSDMLRWITTNLRTFLLAFIFALAVWVTAVTAANPDVTQVYPSPIPIEFIGQDPSLIMTGTVPRQVQVTLRAPRSIWDTSLSSDASIHAIVDLTGLKAGTRAVEVQMRMAIRPVRIISITPQKFDLSLEPLVTITLPIELTLSGKPAIGYKAGEVVIDPTEAVISGAESLVAQVKRVRASLDLTNARQSIETTLPIRAVNESGSTIDGISVQSSDIQVSLPIIQQGGYRDMAVKVIITGKLASGYRLKNITAAPLIVTVFSEDLPLMESLPGYVETTPLNLSDASNNIETQLSLDLPGGVLLVGDQTVSVQIEIVPIEDSRQVSFRQVEVIGLGPGLQAQLSPTTLDVILAGPLPVLNSLQPSAVLVRIDLTGLNVGTYQLTPTVNVAGQGVTVQSILPGTVEVIITRGTGATVTRTPIPTLTPTLTPMPTLTRTPWPTLVPTPTPAP